LRVRKIRTCAVEAGDGVEGAVEGPNLDASAVRLEAVDYHAFHVHRGPTQAHGPLFWQNTWKFEGGRGGGARRLIRLVECENEAECM